MINLEKNLTYYEPFPHLLFKDVMNDSFYNKLCDEFPIQHKFFKFDFDQKRSEQKQNKFSYNNYDKQFYKILKTQPNTKILFEYLVSEEFQKKILNILENNYIKIDYQIKQSLIELLYKKILRKKKFIFEFSLMSSDGGYIRPHTDGPDKLLNFLIPLVDDEKITKIENSGTKILAPTTQKYFYNYMNNVVPEESTKLIREIPFVRNQLFVFIKTHNSLHSVGPMKNHNNEAIMRKSINFTIYK